VAEESLPDFLAYITEKRRGLFVGTEGRFLEIARSALPGHRLTVTVIDSNDQLELIVHQTELGWHQTFPKVLTTYPSAME
jgi:hypothetical protein